MMRAERHADLWVLNGTKRYITTVTAPTQSLRLRERTHRRIFSKALPRFWYQPRRRDFVLVKVFDKSGERLANNAELIFENVQVSDQDRFGEIGLGLKVLCSISAQPARTMPRPLRCSESGSYESSRLDPEQTTGR